MNGSWRRSPRSWSASGPIHHKPPRSSRVGSLTCTENLPGQPMDRREPQHITVLAASLSSMCFFSWVESVRGGMSRCDSRVFLGFGHPANRTSTGGGEKQCTVGPLRSSDPGRHRSRSGPRAGGVAPRSLLSRARPGTGPRRRTGHYSEIARGSLLRSPRKAGCTRPWRTAGGSRQSVTCVSLLLRKGSSDKMH
jgi:hypothetical protein